MRLADYAGVVRVEIVAPVLGRATLARQVVALSMFLVGAAGSYAPIRPGKSYRSCSRAPAARIQVRLLWPKLISRIFRSEHADGAGTFVAFLYAPTSSTERRRSTRVLKSQ